MSSPQRPVFLRYGSAIVALVVATLLRLWLDPLVGDSVPFPTYFLAIMFTAWYGGLGPSLTTLMLGGAAADYLFVPPRYSIGLISDTPQDQVGVGLYFCVGIGIILSIETTRRTQQRLFLEQQHRREEVEAELARAKDRLIRHTRLAAIGQLSASIAHDIRNPLANVRNAVFLLKRSLPTDQPKWIEWVELIDQEIEVANRIIGNLLEMAQGKQPQKEAIDLGEAIREVFDRIPHGNEVRLSMRLDPQPFVVSVDPVQIRQVFGNLMSNSVQAMPNGGEIRIRASHKGDGAEIVVEDDGLGVPEELRSHIFEPLVTTKPTGTGLGLTTSRQIIEGHGGTIVLLPANRPEAAFRVCLPRPEAASSEEHGEP